MRNEFDANQALAQVAHHKPTAWAQPSRCQGSARTRHHMPTARAHAGAYMATVAAVLWFVVLPGVAYLMG